MYVRPVDAGGAHAHQNLAGAGFGIGMLLDGYLLVADGDGAHGAAILCIHLARVPADPTAMEQS